MKKSRSSAIHKSMKSINLVSISNQIKNDLSRSNKKSPIETKEYGSPSGKKINRTEIKSIKVNNPLKTDKDSYQYLEYNRIKQRATVHHSNLSSAKKVNTKVATHNQKVRFTDVISVEREVNSQGSPLSMRINNEEGSEEDKNENKTSAEQQNVSRRSKGQRVSEHITRPPKKYES